jgi:uncharacterized membrane protein YqhA
MTIIGILDLGLLSFSAILVMKVFKLVRFTDIPMLCTIVSVTLALLCFLIYSILLVAQAALKQRDPLSPYASGNTDNVLRMIDYVKLMLIFCALSFDLYKWCLFIASTRKDYRVRKCRVKWLKVILATSLSTMVLASVVFISGVLASEAGTKANWHWLNSLRYYTVFTFSAFLLVYCLALGVLTSRLSRHFPNFYSKQRGKILLSNGCIILSLLARITVNIFLAVSQTSIDDSYNKATWFFPLYQLFSCLFASLFPIAAIITSLMYTVY